MLLVKLSLFEIEELVKTSFGIYLKKLVVYNFELREIVLSLTCEYIFDFYYLMSSNYC
jgi:hypothetical protein